MGDNEGGFLGALDEVGNGKGFTTAGDAEEGLVRFALLGAIDQLLNGFGLVTGRLEWAFKFEFHGVIVILATLSECYTKRVYGRIAVMGIVNLDIC